MADLTDEEFEEALERGRTVSGIEPQAETVRHDIKSGMTVVERYNGCTFAFPPRRLHGLETASDDDLSRVEINGRGYGLHPEALDADFTVGGLMAGRFGSERARSRAILDEAESKMRPHAA